MADEAEIADKIDALFYEINEKVDRLVELARQIRSLGSEDDLDRLQENFDRIQDKFVRIERFLSK
jgi:hypothetical protein